MAKWSFLHPPGLPKIVRTEGEYLYTESGEAILDAAGGAIVTNIGHGRTEVIEAMDAASKNVDFVIPPWVTEERQQLIDKLVDDWLDPHLNHVHFVCGGSEGIECAVKLAFMYHSAKGNRDRTKILKRNISYHGTTLMATAVGGHELRKRGVEHILDLHPKVETPYPLRCPSSDPLGYYIKNFEDTIAKEGPETIAAFLAEPINGASGGAIVPPDGYFEAISKICRQHGILVIVDEVMTGFGRTGTKFGHQHWDFKPDLLVGGKGLAGGYAPITAVAGTDEIANGLSSAGYDVMFHTFSAMPTACAAAATVLGILDEENLVAQAATKGKSLHERMTNAFSNHPHVAEVRGRGLLQAVELVKNRDSLEAYAEEKQISSRVSNHMLRNGVFVYKGGNGVVNDVLVVGPSFTVTDSQLDQIVSTMSDAIDHVTMN